MTPFWRKQMPATWQGAGQPAIVKLGLGSIYRELHLHLTGQLTLTAPNNVPSNFLLGDEWGAVQKIELISDSTDMLYSISGPDLRNLNRYYFGAWPRTQTSFGDGATANPSFDSTLVLPLWSPRSANPIDTAYFSGEHSDFRLQVTYNPGTSVNFQCTGATGYTSNPSIEVISHEQDMDAQRTLLPPLMRRVVPFVSTPSGASPNFRIPLDITPRYRHFLIQALNPTGGPNATPAEQQALFSNVRLVAGPKVYADISESALQQGQWQRLGIPPFNEIGFNASIGAFTDNTGGTASTTFAAIAAGASYAQADIVSLKNIASQVALSFNNLNNILNGHPLFSRGGAVGTANDGRGIYSFDVVNDGYLSEAISTAGENVDLYLEFNVAQACTLRVIANQLIPLARAA